MTFSTLKYQHYPTSQGLKNSYKPQKKVGSSKQYRKLHRRSRNHNYQSDVEVPPSGLKTQEHVDVVSGVPPQPLPNSNSWNMRLYSINHD